MTGLRQRLTAICVLSFGAFFVISCAGSATKPAEEPFTPASAPAEERYVPTSTEMVSGCPGDRANEPRQCVSNEDCCEGFSCSLDPERSRLMKYCLEG
jgi:hypothetical protein